MNKIHLNQLFASFVAALSLLAFCRQSEAAFITTSWTNTFDSSSGSQNSSTSWNYWYDMWQQGYGSNYGWTPFGLDLTMNCTNGPGPTSQPGVGGALKYISPWPGVPQNTGKGGQNQIYGTFDGGGQYNTGTSIDATKYDSLSFDLYVDSASPTNPAGHFCVLSVGFFLNSYGVYTITNVTIPTSNGGKWVRYVCPINKASAPGGTGNLATGPAFNINCYGGENAPLFTNTIPTTMWIDNIYVKLSNVPTPPPTLSTLITEPLSGLNLFSSSASSDQYQRTNIKLNNSSGAGWLGQSNVTFSLTIKNFPSGATYPGYQAHIFITTGPGNGSGLDYADPNLIFLDIKENANGTANGVFRYKTNQPNGNAMVYGVGTLGSVASSTVLGTWSLTFNQDTNVTVRAPDGNTFVTNIPPDAANLFVEPLSVVFGGQPNNPANVGQVVVLSNASITNEGAATSVVDDNFLADTSLNTSIWTPLAAAANTVFVFPIDPGQKLIRWNLPDAGFGLQTTTNLANRNSWVTLMGPDAVGPGLTTYTANGQRVALVPSADLGPNQNFFRLIDESFAKLQVLLPGESSAPGTTTGKTGTPTAQQVGVPFQVTINAVNRNWTVITSATGDFMHLTTTDALATVDPDAQMFGGTAFMNVTLNGTNTFTITASDVTDSTKTSNTSSPVTASP
jgi:hypothetical protein